jgi:DnaJ-class molecular chaperone
MKTRKVEVRSEAICRNCQGTGKRDNKTCAICAGSGHVLVVKEITITVIPN